MTTVPHEFECECAPCLLSAKDRRIESLKVQLNEANKARCPETCHPPTTGECDILGQLAKLQGHFDFAQEELLRWRKDYDRLQRQLFESQKVCDTLRFDYDNVVEDLKDRTKEYDAVNSKLRIATDALEGVIRVADRKTAEFDAAREALSKLKGGNLDAKGGKLSPDTTNKVCPIGEHDVYFSERKLYYCKKCGARIDLDEYQKACAEKAGDI